MLEFSIGLYYVRGHQATFRGDFQPSAGSRAVISSREQSRWAGSIGYWLISPLFSRRLSILGRAGEEIATLPTGFSDFILNESSPPIDSLSNACDHWGFVERPIDARWENTIQCYWQLWGRRSQSEWAKKIVTMPLRCHRFRDTWPMLRLTSVWWPRLQVWWSECVHYSRALYFKDDQ